MEPVSIAEGAEERQTTNRAVSETCPNCGAEVLGSYCHQCGQEHTVRVRPLRGLLTDALGDLFSFDNRLFRTLKLLLFRPGFLTIEYLKGRRAPYVPPFRLYLIVSIVYFSIASLLGTESFFFLNVEDSNEQAFRYIELLPKLMFLILPGFALLLKGLYFRTRRLYVEHLIFALHYHALSFLALTFHNILQAVAESIITAKGFSVLLIPFLVVDLPIQLAVPVYLYLALRNVYRQGRGVTLVKTPLLLVGYLVLLAAVGVAMIQWVQIVR